VKKIVALWLAAAALAGCNHPPQPMTVGGDYRALDFKNDDRHVQVHVYGDRTMILPSALKLYFYDRDTMPIAVENLNGYHLFPSLVETFYMKADEQYFIVQLDEKTRIYNIGKVRNE